MKLLILNLFYFLIIFQLIDCIKWFNFKKEDKDEDCEPEIVAIRKQKIIPVAIPVYNRKRIYSVKTKKLRKKYEDDEDQTSNKEEDNQTSYKEEDNQALYKEQDNQISNKEQDKQVLNKDHDKQASNREEYRSENLVSNKKLTDKSLNEKAESYKSNKNQDDEDNEDYQETDEIIKKAIEDDDEDIDELYSNDDL